MDGLLVNTEPLWVESEHETLAVLGGTWTEADQRAVMGASMAHATAHMRRSRARTGPRPRSVSCCWPRCWAGCGGLRSRSSPGLRELVAEVAASGVPFALVSASVRSVVDLVLSSLYGAGFPEFPVTVAGDEVARSKPDPMPYLRAAELLGVDVTRAVVLEDSANGTQAGWAAGATVVAVPHAVPIEPAERIVVRDSLVGLDMAGLAALIG